MSDQHRKSWGDLRYHRAHTWAAKTEQSSSRTVLVQSPFPASSCWSPLKWPGETLKNAVRDQSVFGCGSAVRESKLQIRSRGKELQHAWFYTSATISAVSLKIVFYGLPHSLWIISAVFRSSHVRWLLRVV